MPLYTGAGDRGETSSYGGGHVSKADARVSAYGEVDELNATLGMAVALGMDTDLREIVVAIQHDLFALGATLADPASRIAARVKRLVDDFGQPAVAQIPELGVGERLERRLPRGDWPSAQERTTGRTAG